MDNLQYIKSFGVIIFLSKTIRRLTLNSDSKISWMVNNCNEKLIMKKLEELTAIEDKNWDISKYLKKKNHSVPDEPIWVMWYQGFSNAPEIVRCCVRSIELNNTKHKVIVLSEKNLSDYIEMPEFINEKFKKGWISRQHYADMVRLYLLYVYGGAWIDATVLNTKEIQDEYFEKSFYSIKFGKRTKDPSHGRWTTFCLFAHKGNELVRDTLDKHFKYWYKNSIPIDYVMFDYFISSLLEKNKAYALQIESVDKNNCNVFDLVQRLNDKFVDELPIKDETVLYKLSWKRIIKTHLEDGSETNFGALLRMMSPYM